MKIAIPSVDECEVAGERRGVKRRLFCLLWESDMTPVKFLLSVASAVMAIGAFLSFGTCHYVACNYMEEIMPWYWWGIVWLVYGAVKAWRIIDGEQRPRIAIGVNFAGAFLFGGVATAVTIARWPYVWLSVFEIAFAAAALWVLARTTINPGFGFRGD